ncbi:MAG: patatin-like phospholipase family protein [Clostridiales bacterium]
MSKNALVLGGGGAKGSYQIGVWKALNKLGWDFQTVTGTSVGALNGALVIQNNYELAEELWLTMETKKIIESENANSITEATHNLKLTEKALNALPSKETGLSTEPLGKLLHEYVDEEKIRKSQKDFGLITVLMDSHKLLPQSLFIEDIPQGYLVDYLWASSSFFPALKTHIIDGKHYIDGGYHDNIPITLALKKDVDSVLAVDLNAIGFTKEPPLQPNQKLITIKPFWDLGAIFNFTGKTTKRNITLGYLDTLKAFKELKGCYYTFENQAFTQNNHTRKTKLAQITDIMKENEKNPLLALVTNSTTKILEKKYRNKFTTANNLLEIGAEAAGEIFNLSPELIYSEITFIETLEKAVKNYLLAQKLYDDFGFNTTKSLQKKLLSLDTQGRTMLLQQHLNSTFLDHSSTAEETLAVLFPQEFMAATFLWANNIG